MFNSGTDIQLREKTVANIFLGITGGIAAYKMPELVRMLQKKGHTLRVGMTANATHFVTPLTLQTLTGYKVMLDQFDLPEQWNVEHIDSAKWMDLFLVCPATANIIGKFANAIADDFLSTLFLALKKPVILCPAMNSEMYSHRKVQHNILELKSEGVDIIEPEDGFLACGDEGKGRLASLEVIVDKVQTYFTADVDLKGMKVVVTAGPTCEDIDPVRFISNRSTGKMGYAIASEATRKNADVTLISGPVNIPKTGGVNFVSVRSASEMKSEVLKAVKDAHILIMTAAVADYTPKNKSKSKIKKNSITSLELVKTEDILLEISKLDNLPFIVGFAAESEEVKSNALKKLKEKKLDIIVANDISRSDIGFASEYNEVKIFGKNFEKELTRKKKTEIAKELFQIIKKQM